jgi:DNA-binding transcriptional ArsR family regulator
MAKPLHHPDLEQIDLSSLLDALSDPVRRRIVRKLNEEKEMPCGSFDEAAKSNLSYHYAKLREAGLTRTRIEGPYRYVSLRLDELETRFPGLVAAVLAASERE